MKSIKKGVLRLIFVENSENEKTIKKGVLRKKCLD
jgi:hypothetical protein